MPAFPYESCCSELIKVRHDPFRTPRCKGVQNFTVFFYGTRNSLGLAGGPGSSRVTAWAAAPEWAELAESVWLLVSLLQLVLE